MPVSYMTGMKDLFPAFEKAYPKQRRLMNQLYHACASYKRFPEEISRGWDDLEISKLVAMSAHHPRAYRAIIMNCYPAINDVSMREPGPIPADELLQLATGLTYSTLQVIAIHKNVDKLRALLDKQPGQEVLRHEVLETVEADAMSVAGPRMVLYFLDPVQAVAAKLRLDDLVVE